MWVGSVGYMFERDYAEYLKEIGMHGANSLDRSILSFYHILLMTTDDFSSRMRGGQSTGTARDKWMERLIKRVDRENTEFFYGI